MTLDQNGVLVGCSSCGTMNRLKYAGLERASKCGKCQSLLPFPAEPIEVTGAQLFDAANTCRPEGITCLIGTPATSAHLEFCNLTVTSGSDVTVGKRLAVATMLAAAYTCE